MQVYVDSFRSRGVSPTPLIVVGFFFSRTSLSLYICAASRREGSVQELYSWQVKDYPAALYSTQACLT